MGTGETGLHLMNDYKRWTQQVRLLVKMLP